jgi:hypothetical protein
LLGADFVLEDGVLVEQRDVIQDEASREQPWSGLPRFGAVLPPPPQL